MTNVNCAWQSYLKTRRRAAALRPSFFERHLEIFVERPSLLLQLQFILIDNSFIEIMDNSFDLF